MVKTGARNEASGRAMSLMALAGKLQTNAQAGQDSIAGVSYSQQPILNRVVCSVAELKNQGARQATGKALSVQALAASHSLIMCGLS